MNFWQLKYFFENFICRWLHSAFYHFTSNVERISLETIWIWRDALKFHTKLWYSRKFHWQLLVSLNSESKKHGLKLCRAGYLKYFGLFFVSVFSAVAAHCVWLWILNCRQFSNFLEIKLNFFLYLSKPVWLKIRSTYKE